MRLGNRWDVLKTEGTAAFVEPSANEEAGKLQELPHASSCQSGTEAQLLNPFGLTTAPCKAAPPVIEALSPNGVTLGLLEEGRIPVAQFQAFQNFTSSGPVKFQTQPEAQPAKDRGFGFIAPEGLCIEGMWEAHGRLLW